MDGLQQLYALAMQNKNENQRQAELLEADAINKAMERRMMEQRMGLEARGQDITLQGIREQAGASRYGAEQAAGASRYGADISREVGLADIQGENQRAADLLKYSYDQLGAQGKIEYAKISQADRLIDQQRAQSRMEHEDRMKSLEQNAALAAAAQGNAIEVAKINAKAQKESAEKSAWATVQQSKNYLNAQQLQAEAERRTGFDKLAFEYWAGKTALIDKQFDNEMTFNAGFAKEMRKTRIELSLIEEGFNMAITDSQNAQEAAQKLSPDISKKWRPQLLKFIQAYFNETDPSKRQQVRQQFGDVMKKYEVSAKISLMKAYGLEGGQQPTNQPPAPEASKPGYGQVTEQRQEVPTGGLRPVSRPVTRAMTVRDVLNRGEEIRQAYPGYTDARTIVMQIQRSIDEGESFRSERLMRENWKLIEQAYGSEAVDVLWKEIKASGALERAKVRMGD